MRANWVEETWKQAVLGEYPGRSDVLEILEDEQALPYFQGLVIYICPDLAKRSGGSVYLFPPPNASGDKTHGTSRWRHQ